MTSPQPEAKGKLLLIEDDKAQGTRLRAALERLGYGVTWVSSGMEGLSLVQQQAFDVVLLDIILQDIDGFAVCRWLKMRHETRDIPVIMISARSDTRDRVQGLHVGANDYLVKPCDDDELEARIFAAMRVRTAQTELKLRNSELESMLHHMEALAITDALTGLYNRRRFTDVLKNQFAVTRRYKNPLSCIMLDVDHFKSINDRYGHDAGDRVLQAVAQKLGESLREVDTAARYGGEEYAVLLPHTSKDNAVIVGERLLNVVRNLEIPWDSTTLKVTVSLGIAASTDLPARGQADALIRAADQALYKAKDGGRDRLALYEPETR